MPANIQSRSYLSALTILLRRKNIHPEAAPGDPPEFGFLKKCIAVLGVDLITSICLSSQCYLPLNMDSAYTYNSFKVETDNLLPLVLLIGVVFGGCHKSYCFCFLRVAPTSSTGRNMSVFTHSVYNGDVKSR